MQCINLNEETVKIMGIHFSYNKKLEEKNSLIFIKEDWKCFKSMENERLKN